MADSTTFSHVSNMRRRFTVVATTLCGQIAVYLKELLRSQVIGNLIGTCMIVLVFLLL